jgi:hypothetical protein
MSEDRCKAYTPEGLCGKPARCGDHPMGPKALDRFPGGAQVVELSLEEAALIFKACQSAS